MNHAVKNKLPRFFASLWQAVLVMFLLAFGMNGQANAGLNDGLVAYWSFDDCSAKDNSGNGNNGTQHGTQCLQGQTGKALDFNGTTDYVEIPASNNLDTRYSNSMFAWINPRGDFGPIINYCTNCWGIHLWQASDYNVSPKGLFSRFVMRNGSFTQGLQALVLEKDKWHFVGTTYDANTGVATLYDNGIKVQEITLGKIEIATQYPIRMGLRDGDSRIFNGSIDEARIYNRALTAVEVTTLYNQGQTITPAFNPLGELVDVEKSTIDYETGKIKIVLKKNPNTENHPYFGAELKIGDKTVGSKAYTYPKAVPSELIFSFKPIADKLVTVELSYSEFNTPSPNQISLYGKIYGVTDQVRVSNTAKNRVILASRTLAQTKPHFGEECITAHNVSSECNNFFAGDELPIFSTDVAIQNTLTHRIVDFDTLVDSYLINNDYKVVDGKPVYDWADSDYGKLAAKNQQPTGDNGRIPLLLIHGWQGGNGLRNPAKLGLWENSELHYSQHFLDYYLTSTALQQKYHVYLYHYPTYKHVTYNAFILKQLLQEVGRDFPTTDLGRAMTTAITPEPLFGYKTDPQNALTIVAHSMGGMVARSLIEEYDGLGDSSIIGASMSQLNQLITLDTPHHGSTGSDPDLLLGAGAKLAGKDLTTQGAVDLNWDNFDNRISTDQFTALNEKYRWPEELANSKAFDAAYANSLCNGSCISTFTMNPWLLNLHSTFVKEYQAEASKKYVLYAAWVSNEQLTKEFSEKFYAAVRLSGGWLARYRAFQTLFKESQIYNIDNIANSIPYDLAEAFGIPDLPNGIAAPVTSALLSGLDVTNIDITLPFNPPSKSSKPAPYNPLDATPADANWWYSFNDSLLPKNADGYQLHSILISKAAEGNPYNHPFGLPYRIFWDYDHEKMINGAYLGKVGAWDALIPTNKTTYPTVAIKATAFYNNSLRNDYIFAASSYRGKPFSINNDQTYNPLQTEPLYLVLERDLLLPKLAVTDTAIDFGTVTNDTPLTHDVSLSNQGIGDLQVNNMVITGRDESLFEVIPSSCPLLSTSQTCGFTVTFTPPVKPWVLLGGYFNVKTATLTIRSNDRDNPNLRITLKARLK